jgi:hypothetical protein
MASLAQRHEIRFCMRAAIAQWLDVIDHCCWLDATSSHAHATQRLIEPVLLRDAIPSRVMLVANLRRSPRH